MPENTQQVLQLILAHGNVCHTDAAGNELAGDGIRHRGPMLPCTGNDVVTLAANGLLGMPSGRYPVMCTSRRGRHYAKHGSLQTFDDRVTDLDLRAWGRGEIEYDHHELLEAIETFQHEFVLSRGEALIVLLKKGVISVAEARRDV
jgi:hypothetical protein